MRESIEKYEQAASQWTLGAPDKAAISLRSAGDIHFMLSEYDKALKVYERALQLSRELIEKLEVFNSIGYVYIFLGENQKALGFEERVTGSLQRLPASVGHDRRINVQAQALNNIGEIRYGLGDLKASFKFFDDALRLWTSVNNRRGVALAHLNSGYSYADSGDLLEASDHYGQSLTISREIGDFRAEASARAALGGVYSLLGAKQRALDSRLEALNILRLMGNQQGSAAAINGIAEIYEDLGNHVKALENYREALYLYEAIGSRGFVGLNKYCIGRVYHAMKQLTPARQSYSEALDIIRDVGDQQIEAHILKGLGNIDRLEGNSSAALDQFRNVLVLYEKIGDLRNQAYTLNSIGQIYLTSNQARQAFIYFSRAMRRLRSTKDGRAEVETLYNLAHTEQKLGNLEEALAYIKEGVGIIEASRSMIDSKDLRTTYFAREHKHYELLIDLLMQLHKQQPAKGYAAAAFMASERARARSLLDIRMAQATEGTLHENGLFKRELELRRLLDVKADYQTRLLGGKHKTADVEDVTEKLRLLTSEYEAVQSQIRKQNPRYSAITQVGDTSLHEIQAEIDSNTLILEFKLGDQRSYVWAVSRTSVEGYELPGRASLEPAATNLYSLTVARQLLYEKNFSNTQSIKSSDSQYTKEAANLSWTLLGQVSAQLGSKRLLLVSDGALQFISFEALPLPGQVSINGENADAEADLLIDRHEVIELPSASIMVAIRRENKPILKDRKTVAIIADPVFDQNDPRVERAPTEGQPSAKTKSSLYLENILRTVSTGDPIPSIPRLPASLREAKAIMALAQPGEAIMATGFDASRDRVMREDLKHYRILHFATHGIVDSEFPESTGLLLSMVDKAGNPQDGYLRLGDIYGLDIPADLVVLSACRTHPGSSVQGEGLIGLSRGFMSAGSKSIVASLWKVDDEATAYLMSAFYKAMFIDGLPPSAALRRAKLTVRANRRWSAPFFWAAFVFQGAYDEHPTPVHVKTSSSTPLIVSLILVIGFLLILKGRKVFARRAKSGNPPI